MLKIKKMIVKHILNKKLKKNIIFHKKNEKYIKNEFFINCLNTKNIKKRIDDNLKLLNINNNLFDYKIYDHLFFFEITLKQSDCAGCKNKKKFIWEE